MRNQDLLTLTHLGENPKKYAKAVVPPIHMNSLHVFDDSADYFSKEDITEDSEKKFFYGRVANPTVCILEEKLAALEHGTKAIAFASGMAAASGAILATCKSGDHIICISNTYPVVRTIIDDYFIPNYNMSVTYWYGEDVSELEELISDKTSLIIIESPTSFVFSIVDIEAVAMIAKKYNVKTYIDNSYCTPILQKPLDLGIDIVMHTMSKYIGGHSDIIGGILIVKDEELGSRLQGQIRELFGGIIGPMEAWLAIRGLRTLALRIEKHGEIGMEVAQFLESHPKVKHVNYPGLPSHPMADIIKKQQHGTAGLLSFTIHGSKEEATEIVDRLKIFQIGCSWGGFESLVITPLYSVEEEILKQNRLTEDDRGMIRIYCGLEGAENLIEDLRCALEG